MTSVVQRGKPDKYDALPTDVKVMRLWLDKQRKSGDRLYLTLESSSQNAKEYLPSTYSRTYQSADELDAAAEYDDATGDLMARYDHGFGLLRRIDAVDPNAYYTFDAIGSASELTDPCGTILNMKVLYA